MACAGKTSPSRLWDEPKELETAPELEEGENTKSPAMAVAIVLIMGGAGAISGLADRDCPVVNWAPEWCIVAIGIALPTSP